jgi:hypothetical protein
MKRYCVTLLFVRYDHNSTGYSTSKAIRTKIIEAVSHNEAFGLFYREIKNGITRELSNHCLEMETIIEIPELNAPEAQEVKP